MKSQPLINNLYVQQLWLLRQWLRASNISVSRFTLYQAENDKNQEGTPKNDPCKMRRDHHVESSCGTVDTCLEPKRMKNKKWWWECCMTHILLFKERKNSSHLFKCVISNVGAVGPILMLHKTLSTSDLLQISLPQRNIFEKDYH